MYILFLIVFTLVEVSRLAALSDFHRTVNTGVQLNMIHWSAVIPVTLSRKALLVKNNLIYDSICLVFLLDVTSPFVSRFLVEHY